MITRGCTLFLFIVLIWQWGISQSPAVAPPSPGSPCPHTRGDVVLLSLRYRQHILAKIVLPPWLPAHLVSAGSTSDYEPLGRPEALPCPVPTGTNLLYTFMSLQR